MERIFEIIKDYYEVQNTDYAIMLKGDWGCGKTYFVKNSIKDLNENFELVYISLNGISSINALVNEIIMSVIGLDGKSQGKRIMYRSAEFLGSFIAAKIGDKELVKDLSILKSIDFISFENRLFCFDDLERLAKPITIKEVLGFINTNFIEHDHAKVLFICNPSALNELDFVIKEKVIRREIEFKYSFEQLFDIAKNNYLKTENEFVNWLDQNKSLITNQLELNEITNLRTVLFIYDIFLKMYLAAPKLNDILFHKLIKFIILISLEFTKGKLSGDLSQKKNIFTELAGLRFNKELMDMSKNDEVDESDLDKSYASYLLKTYKTIDADYSFNNSIFDAITIGYYDNQKYLDEVINPMSPYLIALDVLNQYLMYEQIEINEAYKSIEDGIKKDVFSIYYYQKLYESIYPLLLKGILPTEPKEFNKSILNKIDNVGKDEHRRDEYNPEYEIKYNRHIEGADKIHEKIKYYHHKNIDEADKLKLNKFLGNFNRSYDDILYDIQKINLSKIFSIYSADELYNLISSQSNRSLYNFSCLMIDFRGHFFMEEKELQVIDTLKTFFTGNLENSDILKKEELNEVISSLEQLIDIYQSKSK